MRLAATLTAMYEDADTGREVERRQVALRGTLRDLAEAPRDIVILDVSQTGFLAELPQGIALDAGSRVRVAATPLGLHDAIVVRREDRAHGFVFARPLAPADIEGLGAEQPSSVTPFPGVSAPVPDLEAEPVGTLSARASLALMVGISLGLWSLLAAAVATTSLLA